MKLKNLLFSLLAAPLFLFGCAEKADLIVPRDTPSEWMEIGCVNWPELYPYKPAVRFRMWHDGDHFYIEFQVEEELTKAEQNVPGGYVHKDSCLECYIHPDPEHNPWYYSFEWNAAGHLNLARRTCRDDAEQAPLDVNFSVTEEASLGSEPFGTIAVGGPWTLKVSIPPSALWHDNVKSWSNFKCHMNLYKCAQGMEKQMYLSWAPIRSEKVTFQKTEFFRPVRFAK